VVIVDDLRYATDPAVDSSPDIMGILAGKDIVIADNAFNTPQIAANTRRVFDDTGDLYVHSVLMALGTIRVENFSTGPTTGLTCGGLASGRGCLYVTGGTIMGSPGSVGTSTGAGFRKRYLFDRRALKNPPPRFPVTKRFTEDHSIDVDPQRFSPKVYFSRLK
jgi:hypothetical protein